MIITRGMGSKYVATRGFGKNDAFVPVIVIDSLPLNSPIDLTLKSNSNLGTRLLIKAKIIRH